jgi:hypothetical protein
MSSHSLFTQGNEQKYTTSFVSAETMNTATTVLKLTVLVNFALTDETSLHRCTRKGGWGGREEGKGAKKDSTVVNFQEI